ncbi:hypothetical protein EUTSA_v10012290mg [Eutrema salsugineum]|uniref:Neprosin PEP catalytic domain-containing protein n=2 Tax=Eutrema salsugineum TaxID=72664 RepID=V4JZI1_EUTSA|nr:hypothetical protein EUTSA_v10012290mg [Eutrema salsugineum]
MASFVFSILITASLVTRSEFYNTRDAEIDRLLKKLNKPALRSIKSPDGDIIDCVHMKNHPIYDHPLFKNHTIQMRPSSYPKRLNNESFDPEKHNTITQLWTINGKCPKNSIPIRRTKREDILRADSIERYGQKDPNNFPQPNPTYSTNDNSSHEYAQVIVRGNFHGAKALINVWKPHAQPREFSLAQIWVVARSSNDTKHNSIEVGWQVYESKYGDDNPRYFIYWTADGYNRTGCYNLECSGFVPVNQHFAIGAAVRAVSTLGGRQEMFPATIWKDPHSGHWWLKFSTHLIIGYWPSSLFNHLQNGANEIQWGGEIINRKDSSQHTTTQMGSGNFAQEGYKKASYFRNLEIVDENEITRQHFGTGSIHMTKESCYNIIPGTHQVWGHFFFYGGPGRNPNCI